MHRNENKQKMRVLWTRYVICAPMRAPHITYQFVLFKTAPDGLGHPWREAEQRCIIEAAFRSAKQGSPK